MTFIVQLYFDTLSRYVLSVTFCGAVVLKVIDQNALVKRRLSYKAGIPVYTYTLIAFYQTRVHKSFIGNLARHSFSLFDRNKTQPQASKTREQRLAYHQQNDGRLQKFADNQILC